MAIHIQNLILFFYLVMSDLTKEQEIELFQTMQSAGYNKLNKDQKALYRSIKAKNYPELSEKPTKKSKDESPATQEPQVKESQEPAETEKVTEGGAPSNPFDPNKKRKHVEVLKPVEWSKKDEEADWVLTDNILHSGDYFPKGFVISGQHSQARYFFRKGILSKK